MHAVVVNVTVNDFEAGLANLRGEVVPRVSQAPGFVAGYWLRPVDDKGLGVIVFESEEAARGVADKIEPPPSGEVTLDSVDVREVVANA
jgi:hypothetical protein